MKISQIILKGVNNFEDFHYSFEDEWTQTVPDSLLLMGPNGSGKTTILRAISNLWVCLGKYLGTPPFFNRIAVSHHRNPDFIDPTLWECNLAAVEIRDIFSKPLWISLGRRHEVVEFLNDHKDSYGLGAIHDSYKSYDRYPALRPGFVDWQLQLPHQTTVEKQEDEESWLKDFHDRFIQNRLGAASDLPNMIFLESEMRTLSEIEEGFSITPEQNVFQWLARYSATKRRQGSIENYLFTLKAVDPERYERIRTEVNQFLTGKEIHGFDPTTNELMVTTETGYHPIHSLSSGEKQVLLMIAFITRELRPGGVILIDEPDLHLHVSLSNAFVSRLKQMAIKQKGQLIIATHALELWNRFTDAEKVRLGQTDDAEKVRPGQTVEVQG